jgi:riboflavin kinase/FMN adenylyltransferase
LENIGIQNLVIHPLMKLQITAEEFVQLFVNQFDIHKISLSVMTRFGRNRTANIDDLLVLEKYGFEVEQISVQEINDLVSSTKSERFY